MHGCRSGAATSTPSSKRGSFVAPLGKTPRSNRKIRLAVEGSHHVVESFGGPLPVLITETLSRHDDASGVSVVLTPSGWAWFAIGGKLLVWKYNSHASLKATACRELPLPPSTYSSCAGIACVIESSSQLDVSCLYSTPDGYLRYWSSICREANYVDSRIDLKGQQAKAVQTVGGSRALLATDSSTLFLISLGETIFKCQELKSSGGGGMFSGISRRMSFIFGSNSSQQLSEPLVQILTNDQGDIVVLSSGHVQKWSLLPDGAHMRYQCNLEQLLSAQLSASLHIQDFTFTPVDMQWTRGGAGIVLSLTEASGSDATHCVAVVVNVSRDEPPDSASKVTLLDYAADLQDGGSATLRLIPPDLNSQQLYLLSGNTVVCADLASGAVDRLRFLPAEQILGVCSSGGTVPVLYCLHDGIVCIKGSQLELNLSLLGSPMVAPAPKKFDQSVLDDSASILGTDHAGGDLDVNMDILHQIKSPFLLWLKDGQPSGGFVLEKVSLDLNDANKSTGFLNGILLMSKQLIDDVPANDPRWAEESLTKQWSREVLLHQQQVQSVLLGNQLLEKDKVHDWYRLFLCTTGVLTKLLTSANGRETVATLFEHANKIAAAKALLDVSGSRTAGILDSAVRLVIGRRRKEIVRNLTPQDMFFRELSRIDEVFDALITYQETHLPGADSALALVKDVNSVLLNVAYCIAKHGETLKASGMYGRIIREEPACGRQMLSSLRAVLEKQHELTLTQLSAAEDSQMHATVCQQLAELADAILADHAQCLSISADDASTEGERERLYQLTRSRIIQPFLALGQYERAAALAEKYCDFQLLIEICELTNNQRRLHHYQERYGDQGFSSVLFRYYVREGKQSKLLRLTIPSSQQMEPNKAADQVNGDLEEFLQEQGHTDLSWLHDIGQEHFAKACRHLIHLANIENEFLSKKKTLYSLGKLAHLAADDSDGDTQIGVVDTLPRINRDLAIILHQEQLPSYVIRDLGMDALHMHVLSPAETIEGYVGEYNASATEQDFLKALDLLELTSSDQSNGGSSDTDRLRLHIWSRAVLRDDWLALAFTATSSADLIAILGSTIFMRLVDLLIIRSPDGAVTIGGILPTLQDLLSSNELTHLRADSKFCYMLQAAYEHASQSLGVLLPASSA